MTGRPTHTPDGVEIRVWEQTHRVERSPIYGWIGNPSPVITGYIREPDEYTAEAYDAQGRTWSYVSSDGNTWEPIECN